MYKVDNLEFCTEIFKFYHIRLQLFAQPYPNAEDLDFGMRKALFQEYDYVSLLERLRAMLSPGEILYIQDEFGVSYNVFSLEGGAAPSPYQFGVLGPWRRGEPAAEIIQDAIRQYNLPKNSEAAIRLWLERIPENMEREKWTALCTRIIGRLITSDGNVRFFVPGSDFLKLPDFLDRQKAEERPALDYAEQSLQGGYKQEMDLLNALKKGNFAQAEDLANKYVNFQLEYRKQFEIPPAAIQTELNALLRHAAQEAGVNALRLDETFIKYCRLASSGDERNLYIAMLREYCDLVEQYSTRNCSPVVRQCLDYMDFFYYRTFSLHDLAERASVSEPYLCALFRKEVGMTTVEYLNRVRVAHARQLLRDKSRTIESISGDCGFGDSSYFSRVFKQYTGKSPKKYRDSLLMA